jgi:hypothetical protein
MLPAIRFQLLFGPYKMPRCKVGGWLNCWPMTSHTLDGGRRGGPRVRWQSIF